MLSLSASVICVPVHLCGCLRPRVHAYTHTHIHTASVSECTRARGHEFTRIHVEEVHAGEGRAAHARTDTGWLMEKFSPQRKPLYSLSLSLSLSVCLSLSLSLCLYPPLLVSLLLDLLDSSPRLLYLEFIWCGSSLEWKWREGVRRNRPGVNLKLSRPARGEILERKPYRRSTDPSPGSRSTLASDAKRLTYRSVR